MLKKLRKHAQNIKKRSFLNVFKEKMVQPERLELSQG